MASPILTGIVAGLLATIVMTAVMKAVGDGSPPPTALLWSKFVGGGDPDDHRLPGMVLHLLYGTGAGVVFVVGAGFLGLSIATVTAATVWGLLWGLGLFVVGALFWLNTVLSVESDSRMLAQFGILHVVYGLTLGVWVGLGIV